MMENDLNFGEAVMKTGITQGVNGLQERVSLRLCPAPIADVRTEYCPFPATIGAGLCAIF